MTQTHGDPGGPFVKGSEHVNDVQSGKKKKKDFLKHVVGTNIEMNNNIETEQYLHLEVEEVRHEMELVKVSLKSLVEIQNEIF